MAVNEYLTLNCHFKLDAYGWQEKYPLKATTYEGAMEGAKRIAHYRMAWAGKNVEQVYASIRAVGRPGDARALFSGPLKNIWTLGVGQVDADQDASDPWVGPQFRFETVGDRTSAFAKWVNRILRGCPDKFLEQLKLKNFNAPDDLTPGVWPRIDAATSGGTSVRLAFLYAVGTYSCHVSKNPVLEQPPYILTDFGKVIYRQIASRDTGRPFGISRGRRS